MAICACPVVMLVSVTITPGTTAPAGSTTVPRSAPVVEDCAHKQEEAPTKATIKRLPYRSNLRRPLVIKARHSQLKKGIELGTPGIVLIQGPPARTHRRTICGCESRLRYPNSAIRRNTDSVEGMEYNERPRFTLRGGRHERQDNPGDARRVYQRYYSGAYFGREPELERGAAGAAARRPSRGHCPRA